MLLTYCYYFLSSSLVASACFGTYYYLDKDGATRLAFNISWQGINLYVKTKTYLNGFSDLFSDGLDNDDDDGDDDKNTDTDKLLQKKFMLYNLKDETIIALDEITEEMENVLKDSSNDHLQFLCHEDDKFLRITDSLTANTDKESFTFIKIEKQFIQVELEQNEKTYEIHKFLNEHYFEDNKILDKNFLSWYMNYYNLGNLSNNYQLKIIDNNIEMFTIGPSQYIQLTHDGYKCETEEH